MSTTNRNDALPKPAPRIGIVLTAAIDELTQCCLNTVIARSNFTAGNPERLAVHLADVLRAIAEIMSRDDARNLANVISSLQRTRLQWSEQDTAGVYRVMRSILQMHLQDALPDLTNDEVANVHRTVDFVVESATTAEATLSDGMTRLKVLLTDDTPAIRELIRNVLSPPCVIDVAHNGQEAIDKYLESHYDVVLMDVQMPVLDGVSATRRIRHIESTKNRARTPIVAITAGAMKGGRDDCLAAGADAYVPKPINLQQLVDTVHRVTHRTVQDRDALAGAETIQSSGTTVETFNMKSAMGRLRGDEALFRGLVEFFLDDYPGLIEEIRSGIEHGDASLVARSAHSLKGMAANFDAQTVQQAAAAIEALALESRLDALDLPLDQLVCAVDQLVAELRPFDHRTA